MCILDVRILQWLPLDVTGISSIIIQTISWKEESIAICIWVLWQPICEKGHRVQAVCNTYSFAFWILFPGGKVLLKFCQHRSLLMPSFVGKCLLFKALFHRLWIELQPIVIESIIHTSHIGTWVQTNRRLRGQHKVRFNIYFFVLKQQYIKYTLKCILNSYLGTCICRRKSCGYRWRILLDMHIINFLCLKGKKITSEFWCSIKLVL